ncbi:4,5-DOPA dioxygenase extradiol [Aquirhabdus sp.]|uniref:4,5-DOPA-extradiol-dioxygenase n=1 Tax=Aquirhabdus sp. TaxID=2824160 RepID=UPI00396CC031
MTVDTHTPSAKMPAVFLGHGSPMNAIEQNRYTESWRQLGEDLPRPKAILMISAHWYTRGTGVTAMQHPKTIHDFGGFPQALFDFRYPARGDAELAAQITQLLSPINVILDHGWGLDHGTWSVLTHVYPEADIPVLQLSIDATLSAEQHVALIRQLAVLREQDVLIMGSGNVVHNLRVMDRNIGSHSFDWAEQFNGSIKRHFLDRNMDALTDYMKLEGAKLSVPTAEHFLPFLYIAALMTDDDPLKIIVDGGEMGSITMLSVQVG